MRSFCLLCRLHWCDLCLGCPTAEYAHILCAQAHPGVSLPPSNGRAPIEIGEDVRRRFGEQPCVLCTEQNRSHEESIAGACLRCCEPDCEAYAHATCARESGLLEMPSSVDEFVTAQELRFMCRPHTVALSEPTGVVVASTASSSKRSAPPVDETMLDQVLAELQGGMLTVAEARQVARGIPSNV
eukprot:m.140519 g.140519  ORF g.140519 m.140519 type:complete len:185 (-) comp10014_c0_seq7:661-1215(-)